MATTFQARRRAVDLPIALDPAHGAASDQVRSALRTAIIDGLLAPGLKLPSSRALAEQLRVRRNAVVAAYEHLLSDGLVEARQGSGTFVAGALPSPRQTAAASGASISPAEARPFQLGKTHVDPRLLQQLGSALRRHVTGARMESLGYGDARGSQHLRVQIANHLAVARGMRCDPASIVVVSGTQHAIRLCLDALLSRGDEIWMENPGYHAAHVTLRAAGMRIVPVDVDAEGLQVTHGLSKAPAARAAYVTPSHQFPTGVTMSMPRRVALLEWAQAAGAWIIEDDYDSEFRFSGPPLTALAGIGSDRVIYIGTFTKILFAGLRLAYLVLPPGLVERVVGARAALDRFPSPFVQDAVADLMAGGMLPAHLRRMRLRYREARDAVATALVQHAGKALKIVVPEQGLHLVAYLDRRLTTEHARRIRAAAGIEARLLSEGRLTPGGREGFIVGYSGYELDELRDAAQRLGFAARDELLRASAPPRG